MEELRGTKRLKKRITVHFGQEAADKVAFTEDVSQSGLFVRTTQVVPPGKPVKVALELDHGMVRVEGKVMWAKKVPPTMIRVAKKCGMGIRITRFIEGEQTYRELFAR